MKKLIAALATGLMASLLSLPAMAATRDCSANSMIHCGFTNQADLQAKLQNGDGNRSGASLASDFRSAGLDPQVINSSTMVNGSVRQDGTVWVNGKKVATNAFSYGRQFLPGSTQAGSLWKRPTHTSLKSNSEPLLVVMKNGQFMIGVMPSCGNVVTAKPTPIAKKPLVKTQPVITPVQTQMQAQTQTVNISTPAPTVATTPLPQTGGEKQPIAGLAAGSISLALGAFIRSRQRLQSTLVNKISFR